MGIADIIIIIIIVILLGVAGYFAFSGRGHGSCCDNDGKRGGCDGNCAGCNHCRH